MDFIGFIKSPWGTVCLGVLSSIVGAVFYSIFVRLFKLVNKKVKYKRFIKGLVKVGESYGDGYAVGYAKNSSSFHQALLVGKYEIQIAVSIAKTVGIVLAGVILLTVFQEIIIARPIIVALTCISFSIGCKNVKNKIKSYDMMYDIVFGEEYKESMMKGIERHWDSIVKKKDIKEDKPKIEEQ